MKLCSRCDVPMVADTSIVFTSNPPQYLYECPRCGKKEYGLCSENADCIDIEVKKPVTKEELSKQYADKRRIPDESRANVQFNCFELQQAYEDGFDKAVELVCRFFYERNYSSKFIKNFKEIMEEGEI